MMFQNIRFDFSCDVNIIDEQHWCLEHLDLVYFIDNDKDIYSVILLGSQNKNICDKDERH